MKPNPDIALIYHYDLARAMAGEVVDWQAIPVNVQAGRDGGNLCRAAADFAKRRDLFAMPAPVAVPTVPTVVEQPAQTPQPPTASSVVAGSTAATPDKLRARISELFTAGHEQMMRRHWPEGVPTLKHDGHTADQLARILAAVRSVEALAGFGWHPDDGAQPVTPRSRTTAT